MQVDGAVVLVTGASRGIGRASAELLARRGARVVGLARSAPELAVLEALTGGSSLVVDLRNAAADDVVAAVLQRYGRLDGLVAAAGLGWSGDLSRMPSERLAHVVDLDLRAPIDLVRAALPQIRQHAGGVVLLSSVAGLLGVRGEVVYSAAKGALEVFVDVLRAEGVSIGTVAPGAVRTGFFDSRGAPYERRVPRPVSAERVARDVLGVLETGDRLRVVPRWLGLPVRLRRMAPRLYRALERRLS